MALERNIAVNFIFSQVLGRFYTRNLIPVCKKWRSQLWSGYTEWICIYHFLLTLTFSVAKASNPRSGKACENFTNRSLDSSEMVEWSTERKVITLAIDWFFLFLFCWHLQKVRAIASVWQLPGSKMVIFFSRWSHIFWNIFAESSYYNHFNNFYPLCKEFKWWHTGCNSGVKLTIFGMNKIRLVCIIVPPVNRSLWSCSIERWHHSYLYKIW